MVANKKVTYADWKYRPDVEVTLESILTPLELNVKKEGDKKYKLSDYEYYRWVLAEGWAELDRIAAQYKTLDEWEKRKAELKPCLDEMGYTGWLVIERSRDAKKPSDTKYNYGANTEFLKKIFQ